MSATPQPRGTVPSTLLPELLGFSPQLLLDDIINSANDAVTETVDAMEEFLQRWAEERAEAAGDWDSTQEVEQGLVSFQTLLESHTDIAFDFFEAWSLRNIFAFPADLPIVTRHHEGLNLEETPEREMELLAEIEELRRKIDNVCL
jgi:kinetochore protein Mis12/MTW1